jgi:hypothetical protein
MDLASGKYLTRPFAVIAVMQVGSQIDADASADRQAFQDG